MKSIQDFNTEVEFLEYYRYYVAAGNMQGLIESGKSTNVSDNDPARIHIVSISLADALITALNQEK